MSLSFPLASNMSENDLEFEWLLCLSRTLQACRRLQVRGQAKAVKATRPILEMAKPYSNVERLLFLACELQASQHRQARQVREARRPPSPPRHALRMTKTKKNCLAEGDLFPVLGPAMSWRSRVGSHPALGAGDAPSRPRLWESGNAVGFAGFPSGGEKQFALFSSAAFPHGFSAPLSAGNAAGAPRAGT
jgi:hypothetical protein